MFWEERFYLNHLSEFKARLKLHLCLRHLLIPKQHLTLIPKHLGWESCIMFCHLAQFVYCVVVVGGPGQARMVGTIRFFCVFFTNSAQLYCCAHLEKGRGLPSWFDFFGIWKTQSLWKYWECFWMCLVCEPLRNANLL